MVVRSGECVYACITWLFREVLYGHILFSFAPGAQDSSSDPKSTDMHHVQWLRLRATHEKAMSSNFSRDKL